MSDEFKLQWSVTLPPAAQYAKGHMFNFRADTVDELGGMFDAVLNSDTLQKALDVAALLTAAAVVSTGTSPAPAAGPEPAQGATVTQLPAQDLKTCAHGVREFKTGTNKNTGKAWAGWFCPEKSKAAQCAVIWRD